MSTEKPPVIAIVDDEEMVLTSLRSFLALETDYEIATYDSPTKAVEQIRESTIDLVISDYLMPEMNGIEFLLEIKKLQPYATRILLTGYADKENAIRAINQVQLFQYLEKPWENMQLEQVIRNGLERRHLVRKLTKYVSTLVTTKKDLDRLRKGLMRAFA